MPSNRIDPGFRALLPALPRRGKMDQPRTPTVVLGYKLKLAPTRNKCETLAAMCTLFKRIYDAHIVTLRDEGKAPFGSGRFTSWTQRRAFADYRKSRKAGHQPGTLKAELLDVAQIQVARKATGFDYWVSISAPKEMGKGQTLYLPANGHVALNRALAYPGAKLSESAEIFRKRNKWYARVSVSVPVPEVQQPQGWIGVDVGLRAAVTRSDGYQGPDLRPIMRKTRQRKADQQRNGVDRLTVTRQMQVHLGEARNVVSVALRSGRGVSLEDPKRLPHLVKGRGGKFLSWATRRFAERVLLCASLRGVTVSLVPPPYTSSTCSSCGWAEREQRHKEMFRCWRCGFTHNADINASRIIRRWAPLVLNASKLLASDADRTPAPQQEDNPLLGEINGNLAASKLLVSDADRTSAPQQEDNPLSGEIIVAAKEIETLDRGRALPARIEAVGEKSEKIPTKKKRTSAPKRDARKGEVKPAVEQLNLSGGGTPMISSRRGLKRRNMEKSEEVEIGTPMISSRRGLKRNKFYPKFPAANEGTPMISSRRGLKQARSRR